MLAEGFRISAHGFSVKVECCSQPAYIARRVTAPCVITADALFCGMVLIVAELCRVKSAADASTASASGVGAKRPAETSEAHSPSKQARVASAAYPAAYSAVAPAPMAAPAAPVASAAGYYGQPAAGYQYPGYAYPGYGQPGYPAYSYPQY